MTKIWGSAFKFSRPYLVSGIAHGQELFPQQQQQPASLMDLRSYAADKKKKVRLAIKQIC